MRDDDNDDICLGASKDRIKKVYNDRTVGQGDDYTANRTLVLLKCVTSNNNNVKKESCSLCRDLLIAYLIFLWCFSWEVGCFWVHSSQIKIINDLIIVNKQIIIKNKVKCRTFRRQEGC